MNKLGNNEMVGPNTVTTMRRAELTWSSYCVTNRQVFTSYSNDLPIIVKVVDGFCGSTDLDTVSAETVIRIKTWVSQKRAVVRDCHGRHASIPLTYPLPVQVLGGSHDAESMTLSTIVDTFTLPVMVKFLMPDNKMNFYVGNDTRDKTTFGEMEVLEVYEEKYWSGNSTFSGKVLVDPYAVPLYLPLTFKIAVGVEEGTSKDFKDLQKRYTHFLKNVDYTRVDMCEDIMLYEPERISGTGPMDENPYEFMEPQQYVMLSGQTESRPHEVYTPLEDTNANREVDIYAEPVNLYEDFEMTPPGLPARKSHAIQRPIMPLPGTPGERKACGTDISHQPQRTKPKPVIGPKPPGITVDYANILTTRKLTPKVAGDCDGATGNNEHQSTDGCSLQTASFSSLQEVPKDISQLSVGQVGDCLCLLQMGNHVEDFKRMQIDGTLLVTVDSFMLQQEFGMSLFYANKLMQFCRGWRPKVE